VLRPLAVEHYLGIGEDLSQFAQATGMVEVDVGGYDVFGAGKPQLCGGFLDSGDEHGGARLDYGAVAIPDEINGENSANSGNLAFKAVGLVGDDFKSNGYFFTSKESGLILLEIAREGKFLGGLIDSARALAYHKP
jgi:hypothetical protein